MKKLFIVCLCYLFCGFYSTVIAQVPDPALQQRLVGKSNLKDIMKEVDDYFIHKGLHENKENGEGIDNAYVKWKRWEWYMRDRLGPDGEFVDIEKKMNEAATYRNNHFGNTSNLNSPNNINNVSTGSWGFVGPTSYGTVWGTLPGNGRVDRVAFHPTIATTIFAATPGGGFWKSTDGGTTWANLSNFLPTMGISGIVIDKINPSIIYLLTGTGDDYSPGYFVYDFGFSRGAVGVLKSIDGGSTWSTTGPLYTGGPYAGYKLVQDPRNTNILLAATNKGIYRTTNGGSTWTSMLSGTFYDVKFNPVSSASSNSAYATEPGKVYYSNDEGANWNLSTFNLPLHVSGRNAIAVTTADTNKVYILSGPTCSGGNPFWGVYHSANGGRSFTMGLRTPNILGGDDLGNDCDDQTNYDIGIAAAHNNANFIAMCGETIWTSIDQGISSLTHATYYWGGPANNVHPDVHGVEYNALDNKLYACTDGGLYVSSNNGNNWSFISNGINSSQWYHYAGFPNDPGHLGGGLQDNGIRSRTTTVPSFNHVASGDGFDLAFDPNNSSRFYAIINTSGNLYTGDGATFVYYDQFTNYFPKIGRHPTNTNIIYVGREDVLYTTADEGVHFALAGGGIGGNRRIIFCPSSSTTIYSANSTSVWRNTTGGTGAWTNLSVVGNGWPAGNPTITCVAVNPTNSNFISVTFGGFNAGVKVLYSGNGGSLWSNITNSLPNVPVNCVALNNDNSMYIGTDDGVYYQSPNDIDWLPFYNNLPRVPITDMTIFQTQSLIYVSTFGRGIWFSSTKQACDVNLTVSGTVGGQIFNQASNNISSTQTVVGGEGSIVLNRGGQSVSLLPGFEVKRGNEYKAYLGPCDQHGIPIFAPTTSNNLKTPDDLPGYVLDYDSIKMTNLPYGYLEVTNASASAGEIKMKAKEAGRYTIKIVSKRRAIIQEVYNEILAVGEKTFSFAHDPLDSGLYYIELWFGGKLAHFQEFRIR